MQDNPSTSAARSEILLGGDLVSVEARSQDSGEFLESFLKAAFQRHRGKSMKIATSSFSYPHFPTIYQASPSG